MSDTLSEMKHPSPIKARKHTHGMLPCLLLFLPLLTACHNDMEKVRFFDPKDLPQQSLDSVSMFRSQHGNVDMIMTAPAVTIYDAPQRKTVYPKGVNMRFVDKNNKLVASIRADYAYSLDEKKIIEARNNVVVIDYRSGDTSYLKSLVWNSADHRIYSMDPVRSVNGERVTIGDGFESDEEFKTPFILRQRGTLTFDDE